MTQTGYRLAAVQLAALEQSTRGAVQVLAELEDDDAFLISLDTGGVSRGPGVQVRGRERFRISVPSVFPFEPPSVRVDHRRWQGTPHVQWGKVLCLYAAPSVEWNPAEGMRGFVERLLGWVERAAAGDLDPEGQPLHPPVEYSRAQAGQLVVHPDLGERVPWQDPAEPPAVALYAWCVRDGKRVEVREWLTPAQVVQRLTSDGVGRRVDDHGRRGFLAATLLLNTELSWEYPATTRALAAEMASSGYPGDQLLLTLARTAALNQILAARAPVEVSDPTTPVPEAAAPVTDSVPDPVIVMVGTPSRRVSGDTRVAHLVAWQLDDLGARMTRLLRDYDVFSTESLDSEVGDLGREWLDFARVAWMKVYELRPEVTHRRDEHTPAAWLAGKRILVLGCGALGAPIAEHCVRAGAHRITVLDSGVGHPGDPGPPALHLRRRRPREGVRLDRAAQHAHRRPDGHRVARRRGDVPARPDRSTRRAST